MHVGDDPVKFRTASALVPSYIWCGRVVQETNVPDRVGVRCPDDVSEQTGGFFFEVSGETIDLPFFVVVSCAFVNCLVGKFQHSLVCVFAVDECCLELEYLSEAFQLERIYAFFAS